MKNKKTVCWLLTILLLLSCLSGCIQPGSLPDETAGNNSAEDTSAPLPEGSAFAVHFIDVGQADAALVLCEPFLCRLKPEEVSYGTDIIENWEVWYGRIRKEADIVGKLAEKYGAVLVPSRQLFEDACRRAPASFWSVDGIHLTPAGNGLLAGEWLRCVKGAGNVPV